MSENKKYIGSLDGLRALAIVLVIAYHLNLPFARGGFIGVDMFFVLSGYLITCNLLLEWNKKKNFNLREFWKKRIVRLIPAVIFMVVSVLIFCYFMFPESFKNSQGDGIAAFFYVSNWWYIIQKIPYFDSFSVAMPLKHLWSLAIEEQFYVFWPIVLLGLLKWLKKRQNVLKVLIVGAFSSALLMGILYSPANVDRVYYGTDTRLFAILVGCSLAFVWPYYYLQNDLSKKSSAILDGVGLAALAALLLFVATVSEYGNFLYRGGFFLVAILTAILLAALVHPSSQLAKIFSVKPLEYIGKFSYSLYLWHYPVIALFTPIKTIGTIHPLLIACQLILIAFLAYFSYQYVENPIRKYGLKGSFNHFKQQDRKSVLSFIMVVGVISSLTIGLTIGNEYLLTNQKAKTETKDSKKTEPKVEKAKQDINQLLMIGDSISEGIEPKLKEALPKMTIDAEIGRQLVDAQKLVDSKYKEFNTKETLVFIELGSNSPFNSADLDKLIDSFGKANIYLINTRVPRNWEGEVNEMLRQASESNSNVQLIDWYNVALSNPELLEEDGVHLTEEGAQVYVGMMTEQLNRYNLILD